MTFALPLVVVSVAIFAPTAHARCATPSALAAVEDLLAAGDRHFDELEDVELRKDLDDAAAAISCLEETLPPATAAHLHRLTALWHDLQGDRASRDAAFTAAGRADPEYRFPPRVLAPDNPTARAYVATIGAAVPAEPVPEPAPGVSLLWDGATAEGRPAGLPVVLQVVEGEGQIDFSGLLSPLAPLPDYPRPAAVAVVDTPPDPDPVPNGRRGKIIRISLLSGGGALLAGSAACSYLAWDKVQSFEGNYYGESARTVALTGADDAAWTSAQSDTDSALGKYRLYTGSAVGLGVLGAGAVAAAFVIEW